VPGAHPHFRACVADAAQQVEPQNPSNGVLHWEGPAMNKTKRVSFRIDAALAKQMRDAASKEALPLTLADFTRKLVLWAWQHYRTASSLWLLRRAVVTVPKLTLPERSCSGRAKKQATRISGVS
jgi:hypothetical protein